MDVTIIVGTYGSDDWADAGWQTAIRHDGVHVHGPDLATARNQAAYRSHTEWLVFLDADDKLAPGYLDGLAAVDGDLRAPVLELRYEDGRRVRPDLPGRDIERMNPCCIGTGIRRQLFMDCGGFPQFSAWEDWALFLRAHRRGATIAHAPAAVYEASVRPGSRNQSVGDAAQLYKSIRAWA